MRAKFAVVLFGLLAVTLAGQEEPLPLVSARSEPTVFLAVEPIRDSPSAAQTTLAEAARANDYATFHALYERSRDARFATLDDLWTYSMNDPLGAFYGDDMHDRIARAYPGFAKYIEEFRIIDANGNVFYPSSETRAFLLAHAGTGEVAPRVLVARAPKHRTTATTKTARPRFSKAENRVAPAKQQIARVDAKPVAPAKPIVQPKPIVQAKPPVVAASIVAPLPVVKSAKRDTNAAASRGILLLIVGLLGIGLLALILRTPREEEQQQPEPETKSNVEPIRRPVDGKPRATGSHG